MTRTPSPLLREESALFFFQRKILLRRSNSRARREKKREERPLGETKKRATFLSSRAKEAAMRLGFLRVSSFCAFPLSFRANWKCQNGPCFWCSSSFFSLSRKREKRQCRLEKSLLARAWSGERDATKTRAKKRHGRVAYLFFRTNSICAKEVFVCSRTKVESRKARARLAKNFVWRLFPLEKKKNILAFAPFFAPCALFFSFLGSFFSLFWQKMAGNSFIVV